MPGAGTPEKPVKKQGDETWVHQPNAPTPVGLEMLVAGTTTAERTDGRRTSATAVVPVVPASGTQQSPTSQPSKQQQSHPPSDAGADNTTTNSAAALLSQANALQLQLPTASLPLNYFLPMAGLVSFAGLPQLLQSFNTTATPQQALSSSARPTGASNEAPQTQTIPFVYETSAGAGGDESQNSKSLLLKKLNWVNASAEHFNPDDSINVGKKRRRRTSAKELEVLEGFFKRSQLPNAHEREELSRLTGMTPRAVQVWFQNKRQSEKRKAAGANGRPDKKRLPAYPARARSAEAEHLNETTTAVTTASPIGATSITAEAIIIPPIVQPKAGEDGHDMAGALALVGLSQARKDAPASATEGTTSNVSQHVLRETPSSEAAARGAQDGTTPPQASSQQTLHNGSQPVGPFIPNFNLKSTPDFNTSTPASLPPLHNILQTSLSPLHSFGQSPTLQASTLEQANLPASFHSMVQAALADGTVSLNPAPLREPPPAQQTQAYAAGKQDSGLVTNASTMRKSSAPPLIESGRDHQSTKGGNVREPASEAATGQVALQQVPVLRSATAPPGDSPHSAAKNSVSGRATLLAVPASALSTANN
ncbi:LIM/homeobox protein Lhx5 [Gaertneriomyces sp. JEL0708]|nr:LIM/homeobox protein Lhx5 [Gaertneriomyces sp. JEL0708]